MHTHTHIYRYMESHSKIQVMCPVIITTQAVQNQKGSEESWGVQNTQTLFLPARVTETRK